MTWDAFCRQLAAELNDLAANNLLTKAWVLDGTYNQCSWLHARIFGAMARAVVRPFVPMIEVKWYQGFEPDLCITERDTVIGVVEYESTNSSDERMIERDLAHFEGAILHAYQKGQAIPAWWLVISTLPNCQVKYWKRYYPLAPNASGPRNANPLVYHEGSMHEALAQTWQRLIEGFGQTPPTELVWANLDHCALQIMSINGARPAAPRSYALQMT